MAVYAGYKPLVPSINILHIDTSFAILTFIIKQKQLNTTLFVLQNIERTFQLDRNG